MNFRDYTQLSAIIEKLNADLAADAHPYAAENLLKAQAQARLFEAAASTQLFTLFHAICSSAKFIHTAQQK